jgi:uncharacterized protein
MSPVGDWMQTYTGRQFWPVDPQTGDFDIADIAHALANICRFGGHTQQFYSVAQHCVVVSHLTPPGDALDGLMHDAAEAYIGDMIRPLKRLKVMGGYCAAERRLEMLLAEWAGARYPWSDAVHLADDTALATEARDIMGGQSYPWGRLPTPTAERIVPLGPQAAELQFLDRWALLSKTLGIAR